jgi:hypothetical protein
VGVILVGSALLAACAGDDPEGGPESVATTIAAPATTTVGGAGWPSDVPVEIDFVPNLALRRAISVSVDNTRASDMTVNDVELRSPLFESVARADEVVVVDPGRRRDMELDLGDAICPASPGPSLVDLAVVADGQEFDGSFPIEPDRLEQLNARECGQRAVFERVDLAFTDDHVVESDVLSTGIDVIRKAGDEAVTVTDVGGTLLFSLTPAGAEGARASLGASDDAARVDLTIEVHRCDAHTVSQSQVSYRFPVWVAIGDAEPQYVFIEPDPALRTQLESLVQACIARELGG